ncbi:MAG: energy transducer TonB [Flavobacteriales bacterium]|nr:energy transducer TonB [Flavobacteriales bacterium]
MRFKGKVYVRFVVEKDGSISEKSVVKDVDPFLDEEAIRLVNIMPRWTPGLIAGQPVRTRLILPFSFRLF